jgi:dienelactone hydrolase
LSPLELAERLRLRSRNAPNDPMSPTEAATRGDVPIAVSTPRSYLFLAEKDEATGPILCNDMASTSRQAPVRTKLWKGAYHAYEDRGPKQGFHGHHIGYNAEAAEGTIKAGINALKEKEAKQ